jgi:CRP-like cAMP-binding protein
MRAGQYEAGATLAHEGQVPAQIVYLRRGQVVLSGAGAAGRNRSCAVRGAGTMLGLDAVLGRTLPYDVRALTDVAVCTAETAAFGRWLGPLDSPLGVAFCLSVGEAARRASERHALEGTALRRVARFLLQTTDGDLSPSPDIPRSVLANVLGLRAETLSRALASLRESGALGPGRRICVVDRDSLARSADES